MKLCLGLIVALLLVTISETAPARAERGHRMVLTGSGPGSVIVEFRQPVKIRIPSGFGRSIDASSNGRIVGFAVSRLGSSKILAGAVRVPPMDPFDGELAVQFDLARRGKLQPGRYLFTLIAEKEGAFGQPAHATVTLAVDGLDRDMTLLAQRPAPVEAVFADVKLLPGFPFATANIPVDVSKKTTLLMAASSSASYGQAHSITMCLHEGDSRCAPVADGSSGGGISPGASHSGTTMAHLFPAGTLPMADMTASYRIVTVGITEEQYAVLVALR